MSFFFKNTNKQLEISSGMVLRDPDGKRWIVVFSHDRYFVLASEPFSKNECMLRHYRAHVNRDGISINETSDCFYTKEHLIRLVSDGGWTVADESDKFARKVLEKKVREYERTEDKLHRCIKELQKIRDETNNLNLKAKIDMFLDVNCWPEIQKMKIVKNEQQ